MGGNTFYTNAEAYAFEILQQKLIKEAQRSAQQTVIELSALKSLFNQGQFIYCIPFGGITLPTHVPSVPICTPFPALRPPDPAYNPPEPLCHSLQSPHPPPSSPPPLQQIQDTTPCLPPSIPHSSINDNQRSTVHVNVKNALPKMAAFKPGSDDCNLGKDGIEVNIDLRDYLPAEIFLDVEEKTVEIKACHVDSQGSKTFARRYDLPTCIILDSVKCVLSHDGHLMFSAAWLKME